MGRARASADPFRVCPPGAQRGIDVARMYPEIAKIVRAKFPGPDVDELVQETATAIMVKNGSEASAFDPSRSGFGHYVYLVARSKAGHMAGGATRRAHRAVLGGDELLDVGQVAGEASEVPTSTRTAGELAELLADQAARARVLAAEARGRRDEPTARYQEGAADGLRAVAELLGEAFGEAAPLPAPRAPRKAPPAAPEMAQDRPKIRGWKAIAKILEVDERTARGFALREQLGVRVDHKGVWITRAALTAWVRGRDRAWARSGAAPRRAAS